MHRLHVLNTFTLEYRPYTICQLITTSLNAACRLLCSDSSTSCRLLRRLQVPSGSRSHSGKSFNTSLNIRTCTRPRSCTRTSIHEQTCKELQTFNSCCVCFRWDSLEAFMQHDVQELSRVVCFLHWFFDCNLFGFNFTRTHTRLLCTRCAKNFLPNLF